jgi:hypothetical protein
MREPSRPTQFDRPKQEEREEREEIFQKVPGAFYSFPDLLLSCYEAISINSGAAGIAF